ncbi:hypothetical protein ACVXZY_14110 [Staphylococcus aureus]
MYGDVKWTAPLTVDETVYAQSLKQINQLKVC